MMLRVIIAGDYEADREVLQLLLTEPGDIEVLAHANDGSGAVRLARDLGPDIVLLDLGLDETIRALRAIRRRWSYMRSIALSVHTDADHAVRVLEAGADAYLPKWAAGTELVRAVRAIMRGRRYVSPAAGPVEPQGDST